MISLAISKLKVHGKLISSREALRLLSGLPLRLSLSIQVLFVFSHCHERRCSGNQFVGCNQSEKLQSCTKSFGSALINLQVDPSR